MHLENLTGKPPPATPFSGMDINTTGTLIKTWHTGKKSFPIFG